jgi:hypothetical protein
MPVILAHQGGWDEFLLVAVPILVIVAVLALVKKRVDRGALEADERTDVHD